MGNANPIVGCYTCYLYNGLYMVNANQTLFAVYTKPNHLEQSFKLDLSSQDGYITGYADRARKDSKQGTILQYATLYYNKRL